ncbi:Putative phage-related lipoprotein [Erwinia billingiae Eb661]|uniref:Putative phage-related lipoprotein n=1 Tax=Erwinia billingiae (strain Eb661) TaxID=634500 RepID=D8MV90_ERWBE|nr:Putative phage-related lipoprotein [Erwinia billingiae Eb661]
MISSRILVLLLPLFLTACMSTPNEARRDTPVFSGTSGKSPDNLSECIYEGWTNTRVMLERDNTTHTERSGGRVTVFTWKDSLFADILSEKDGSRVKFYKTFGMGYTVSSNRNDVVKDCL